MSVMIYVLGGHFRAHRDITFPCICPLLAVDKQIRNGRTWSAMAVRHSLLGILAYSKRLPIVTSRPVLHRRHDV